MAPASCEAPLPLVHASDTLFLLLEDGRCSHAMTESTRNASEGLAELVEACPFPVVQCDVQGRVLLANSAFQSLLEVLHIPQDQASRILPDGTLAQLEAVLHSKGRTSALKREIDGRFLEFTFSPVRSKKQVIITINDRTEQRSTALWMHNYARELDEVNRQMKQAQAHLVQSEKMASLGQLVAGIAHEINTPIGSINSNNDVLIRSVTKMREFFNCEQCPVEVRENPDVVKLMRVLEEINQNNRIACDRIIDIIRSLRNFARLDEAERQRVNIHDGLDSSLILVHHQLKNRIEIVKDYGTLPEIECFSNQLNQVFMNLLVNAAQAMPGRGTLTIKTLALDSEVQVKISDTGVGIPRENMRKIFDSGFTTKGVGIGTGLGLSICRKIIQDHRGRIAVESEVGHGTTFTITLPVSASTNPVNQEK
jgi:signal transduction histidine kinase